VVDVRSILYAESSASTDKLAVDRDDADDEDAPRRSANGSRWIFLVGGGSMASVLNGPNIKTCTVSEIKFRMSNHKVNKTT